MDTRKGTTRDGRWRTAPQATKGHLPAIVGVAIIAVLALACIVFLQACAAGEPERVAARFGDHVISEEEVEAYADDYRQRNGLQDDAQWESYLISSAQTPATWRQEAIRTLADRILVLDKAAELGITADSAAVEARIVQEKEAAGIDSNDDAAWADYLREVGQTPEQHRDDLEFSDVEQQVFKVQLDFDDALRNEMCDDYIAANLADQVVCRYAAIAVPLGERDRADACLAELKEAKGEQLEERFWQLVESANAQGGDIASGDVGWDFAYDEARIDPDLALRRATLERGGLYDGVLEGTDALRVVLCTDWASFARTPTYESLESEGLKSTIEGMTMVSSWTAKCMRYLADLEEQAHIQITEMPADAAYATDAEGE